jgi:nicotinamide-nucleotide amidase
MNLVLEIISIGNELLIGKISNINARWIAKRATTLGLDVRRIVTVKDDVDEISSAVQEAIQRHPRFIVTTGGLGPTFDDKSLEGVAKGTGRKLEVNHQALRQIDEIFQSARAISLPGVPQQVRIIFEESIVSLLREASGNMMFFETRLDVKEMWEEQLSPLIDQVMAENPQVYIKSFFHLAKGVGRFPHIELQLSTFDEDSNAAENRLKRAR